MPNVRSLAQKLLPAASGQTHKPMDKQFCNPHYSISETQYTMFQSYVRTACAPSANLLPIASRFG